MSSLDQGPYNQRNSSYGMNPFILQQIQNTGRDVLYSPQGRVRSITSRPGAPLSPLDTMRNMTTISDPSNVAPDVNGNPQGFDSPNHVRGWNEFFKTYAQGSRRPQPNTGQNPSSGNAHIAADEQFGGGSPTSYGTNLVGAGVPPPMAHVGASIAQNSQWLGQNGIAFPPPPTNRFPGDSGNNSLASTVALQPRAMPKPLTGPLGNAGTDAANLAQNQSLYAPGGWKDPQPAASNFPSGWQGSRSAVTTGNYTTPYGTASVSNFPRTPTLPASSTTWGQNDNG